MTISVENRLKSIEERLDILEGIVRVKKDSSGEATTARMSMRELLTLPDSLRKTMRVI